MMQNRTQSRAKSALRRPLSDKSICQNRPETPCIKKEITTIVERKDPLQQLSVVSSNLSGLISEINQLVAQQKELTKKGGQEIESFTDVLSEMHSSLKPWFSRLQQAFNSKDKSKIRSTPYPSKKIKEKEENKLEDGNDFSHIDLQVSPSPLVSWRPGPCTVIDAGKQLFLLTPLPPKSRPAPSKKTPFPCTVSDFPGFQVHPNPKSKPGKSKPDLEEFQDPVLENLERKYEIINRKKEVSETLKWFLSPPKTCVVMEPGDETNRVELAFTPRYNTIRSKKDENLERDLFKSTARKKGEETLKRELWTRFEATGPLNFDKGVFERVNEKGFLDMLEEAEN